MTRSLHRLAALAGAAVLVPLLTSCALLPSPEGDPGGDAEATGPGVADVFVLVEGDCFDDSESGVVEDVLQLDCGEPHDYEVYESFTLGTGSFDEAFPGKAEVVSSADEGCIAAFEPFVGIGYESSIYEITHLVPTVESWSNASDREVLCLVHDPSGKTTGTLAGAGI
ncbi:septum formation family protein [Herbiconiux moechotypicola]|uniref:Septum formation family protein n=1 Tax=Herbiconiux moechotypicola TaxID=637393 RepID=A0ABN3DU95_9MICO|nr:septum formation family protein [Herbiconiux moechotypicola]MCS5731058.1 septum formation family protein [Herbiconiux moechotypicola]